MIRVPIKKRGYIFGLTFIFGFFLFLYGLGSTGLVDETPPLFASAGRAMSESGDWLTPRVNGILRFDKPPFFYWLMAIFYSISGNEIWDKFGSLAARLPSALSALFLMLMIADTLFCSNENSNNKSYLALVSGLSFAMSPLIIIWSRTAVSDSLLCGTVGISLLAFWRKIIKNRNTFCFTPWLVLGFAILTKGPVAIVIIFLTLTSYFATQKNWKNLLMRINPIRGILIALLVSLPWYCVQIIYQGRVFLDSFFGYHNIQRFTSVVNNHSEPWWFFIYIMLIGSLPFSVFLIHGIYETLKELIFNFKNKSQYSGSIYIFSLCWLLSILIFFSLSATKLPSYWLPAIPASSILITKSANILLNKPNYKSLIWFFTALVLFGFSISFYFSNEWLSLINDPEMPNLAEEIRNSELIPNARIIFSLLSITALYFIFISIPKAILYLQILLFTSQFFLMIPIRRMADNLRQLPIRNISRKIKNVRSGKEPLAMVGIRKPSLHFYSEQIVFYESNSPTGMINLSERFKFGRRISELDQPNYDFETILIVIDEYSKNKEPWINMMREELGVYGIYSLIRIKKNDLNEYASYFKKYGYQSTWRNEKYEKF